MRPQSKVRLTNGALWVYIVVILVFVIAPVWYAITGSVRGSAPATLWEQFWPRDFTLENFAVALRRVPLQTQMINTLTVTVAQTLLQLVTALLAATALVYGRLRHPNLVFGFIMLTMMLPSEGIIVAKFLLINNMGLFDTLVAVFIPFAAMAFPTFLLRQAFLSLPPEIHEAAVLDGAGPLRIVWQILMPLTRPVVYSVVVTSAIAAWNGYVWPLIITDQRARTVQVGVSQLSDAESTDVGVVLAGLTMVSIPLILLVLVGQRFLTRGLTEGASK